MVLTWTTGPKGRRCPAWYFLVLLSLPLPPFRSVRPFHIPLSSLPPATKLSDELSPRILHEKVAASLMQQNGGASIVRTVAALMLPCNTVSASPIDFCGGLDGCFPCGLEVGTRNWDGGSKFGERKLADSPIGISLFLAKQNSVCVLQNVGWMYNRRLGSLLCMLKLMSHVGGYLREKAWIKFFLGSCDKKSDFKWKRRRRTGKRGRRRYKGESILKVFLPSSFVVGLHVDRISIKNLMHVFRTLLINSLVSINV